MDTMRVGMIGAGWTARQHAGVLESAADAEVVAVSGSGVFM